MQRFILFLFLLFPSAVFSSTIDRELQNMLDSNEYFRFRGQFIEYSNTYPANQSGLLYYGAWYDHLFGKVTDSNQKIAMFCNSGFFNNPDSLKADLLMLQLQNDFRLFQYRSADSVCNLLLNQYSTQLNADELSEIRNFAGITKGLLNVPAQTIERNGDLDIEFKRDIANLIRIPVSVHGKKENFMFDTGANLSTISESEAKRMGIRLIDVSFGVASSSRAAVESKLGIADELKIGNVIFRNVVFIVLPDKALKFAGGLYKIKGIIGLPVIAQLGEIQVHKNGHLISPQQETQSQISNLGLLGNTPFINLNLYGTDHPYLYDTGAGTSIFNNRFLRQYRDSLTNTSEKTRRVGGAGGMTEIKTVSCTNLPYVFGDKTGTIKKGMIQLSALSSVYETFFGIAGEDIFMQWKVMTINFNKGFVVVSN